MDTSSYVCTVRRPYFVEGDVGPPPLKSNSFSNRRGTFRSLSSFNSSSSSRSSSSGRLYEARCEDHHLPHFLESCFICKKPLNNRDIFMYRGDTPFCSEECRQEQIEIDEAKEMNWNLSSSMKAIRKDQQKSTSNKSRNYQLRTNTVAAAS